MRMTSRGITSRISVPAVSHPNSNEYATFLQDTVRMTGRLALSSGVRHDLQTFSTRDLVSNPLWPASGKVPRDENNVAPRIGLAYSIGNERPLVIRAGYGWFYPRIPQMYTSTVGDRQRARIDSPISLTIQTPLTVLHFPISESCRELQAKRHVLRTAAGDWAISYDRRFRIFADLQNTESAASESHDRT